MFYSEETEKIVIAYLLKDTRFLNMSRHMLKDDFFYYQNLRRMFIGISKAFDKWHMTVSYEVFCDMLKKVSMPIEEETAYQILFHEISAIPTEDDRFNYFVDVLKDLKIKRDLNTTVSRYTQDVLESGTGEDLLTALSENIHKMRIESNLLVVKKSFMFDEDFIDERFKDYEHRKQFGDMAGIPFGWAKLDNYTSGHYPGQVTLVFSRTGGGKTRSLTTFAFNGSSAGRKGMFVTIEMSNTEIARLYDSRLCRLHFEKLKKGKLDPDEEAKWRSLLKTMSEKDDKGLYIVDMPRGCTTAAIEEEINSYERRYGKLDFVIIDYLMLMDSIEKTHATHERIGNITKELKQMARIKQVSVLTAIQANRKAQEIKGEEAGTEHISLSDQVAAHCNNILYLHRTPADLLANTLQVNLVKFRDGGNITFSVHADWAVAYIGDEALSVAVRFEPINRPPPGPHVPHPIFQNLPPPAPTPPPNPNEERIPNPHEAMRASGMLNRE